MKVPGTPSLLSVAEYLELEQDTQTRYEYHAGEVFAQAGGGMNHNRISRNFLSLLWDRIKQSQLPCEPFGSDQKVHIPESNSFVYPDVSLVGGEIETAEHTQQAIVNPVLIIEVLSPTTAEYDLDGKFQKYRQLSSLQEYLLVAQEQPKVTSYFRAPEQDLWQIKTTQGLEESLLLLSMNITVAMADVYQTVSFDD